LKIALQELAVRVGVLLQVVLLVELTDTASAGSANILRAARSRIHSAKAGGQENFEPKPSLKPSPTVPTRRP
jgi:hypothetical protein